jgi:glycosyltransferase involved in cell wall biosynthesis
MSTPIFSTYSKESDCTLSIVVPVFNEEEVLPAFHARLTKALSKLSCSSEIIYIDDGSHDRTPQVLDALQCSGGMVGVARFSRNFGKEVAMSAGLRLTRGDAVIVIDADLQDQPELIPLMMDAWLQGADMVNMRRRHRDGETRLKKASASAFYRVINRLSEVPIPEDVGDFRLLSRRVVDALNQLPERNRFMKGLFAWVGFRQVTLDYDRDGRAAGVSKWPYWRLWNLALEGITAFSTAPLKVATYVGFLSALLAFFYGFYFLIKTWFMGDVVHGFPSLMITILFLGGLQLMGIGILGEYVGRLFMESKNRPLYLT